MPRLTTCRHCKEEFDADLKPTVGARRFADECPTCIADRHHKNREGARSRVDRWLDVYREVLDSNPSVSPKQKSKWLRDVKDLLLEMQSKGNYEFMDSYMEDLTERKLPEIDPD